VRITEIAPEVLDQIAEKVAERIARRPQAPVAVVPPGGAKPAAVSRATPRLPAPPVPVSSPLTDAEVARARESVPLALGWLARHQSGSGAWSSGGFAAQCHGTPCTGPGAAPYDVGVTGLALLCLLGAGETPNSGEHADNVKRGLAFLVQSQDPEGCVGPRTSQHFMYNHGYAALALVEAYGLTSSPVYRAPAQRAVDFVLGAQNPYLGWRYGVRDGDNDTSVTGLMVLVLRAAKTAGLTVDDAAFRGARAWIDKMTEPEYGRTGYQQRGGPPARTVEAMARFPADRSEAMTAVGVTTRLLSGADPATSDLVEKGARLVASKPPVWSPESGSIDLYGWYWGTLALSRVGGDAWTAWRAHAVRALGGHQVTDAGSDARGSWDPVDPWGAEGGRVYATALACLTSQIAVRNLR
jgi:hypothetical protein